ncbi:MAG TPA: hypothetical protein VGX28_16085 [Frankiaceae bacterium]|nr:hypothetical protein [Frankiaceae bacterium]
MGTIRQLGGLCGTALTRSAAVLAGVLVAGAATGVSFATQDVALTMGERPADPLRISGSIAGVVAGAPDASLTLTLANGGDAARDVRRVRVDATGVVKGPAHCDGGYLTVGEWRGAVTVRAGAEATVQVPVAVAAELPAECAAVVWGLLYTAY